MTSDEVRRITERRNETAAAMDACELAEAHRDETGESVGSYARMTEDNNSTWSPYGFGCTYY